VVSDDDVIEITKRIRLSWSHGPKTPNPNL